MHQNENIKKELKELSSELVKVPFVPTLTTPDGYFDGLEKVIMSHIQNQESVQVSEAKEEMQQLSPLLSGIKDKKTYNVPHDYFEKNATFLAGIPGRIAAPVISLPIRKRMIQLAVAASFVGILSFFTYLLLPNDQNHDMVEKALKIQTEDAFNRYLANVNEEEIIAYLNQDYLLSDHNQIGGFVDINDLPDETAYFEEVILGNN